MKDKRQRMALTWPYTDPHFAAYMIAATAAATAAAYGQPAANYWNRSAPYPGMSYMVMRPSAPAIATAPTSFLPSPVGLTRSVEPISGNTACCNSSVCRGCNSPQNGLHSSLPITSRTAHTPEINSKPLFQPYKNDLEK